MSKPIDYDWRTRVHYEQMFAEQCAIAVKEAAINAIHETEEERKAQAERIGSFFADALNALYKGFTLYPQQLNGSLADHQSDSNSGVHSQQPEDRERLV